MQKVMGDKVLDEDEYTKGVKKSGRNVDKLINVSICFY